MSYFKEKTPPLEAGLARNMMQHFLMQVKQQRGLTTFIEHCGVNGRWLKSDDPYDIRFSKLVKIMEIVARYRGEEEFLADWNTAGEHFLNLVRTPRYLIHFL